jgi:MFS family permease
MSNRRTDLLRNPSFLWLFGGGALSMLGDQFTLIALPWVVLKLTGDPLAMGTVLATMAVPRAVLMLVGGALIDLSSAKRVLLATKYANAACLGLLAYLILAHSVSRWRPGSCPPSAIRRARRSFPRSFLRRSSSRPTACSWACGRRPSCWARFWQAR